MQLFFVVAAFVKADTEKDVNMQEGATDGEERVEPQPRALHKTQSVFLRNLPALIMRQEIEEVAVIIVFSICC